MNRNIFGIVVFVFSLIFGQTVFAHSEDNPWGCEDRMKHMVETLKLDSAQEAKIKAIKEQFRTSQKTNWDQMKILRMQINKQIMSDNMDQTKVDSLVNAKVQLISEMMKAKIMAKHQVYGVLNAQQKVQYQQMERHWEEKMLEKYENCHS